MAKYRQGRINDSVAQEISMILRDVKDPRVSDATGHVLITWLSYTDHVTDCALFTCLIMH